MKLILRRSQKSSMMGKTVYVLEAKAELSDEEAQSVKNYKMGKEVLYEKIKIEAAKGAVSAVAGGAIGMVAGKAADIAAKGLNLVITVNDLANGKVVECKDLIEMVAVERQLTEAAHTFKQALDAAATFGGEEVIEL